MKPAMDTVPPTPTFGVVVLYRPKLLATANVLHEAPSKYLGAFEVVSKYACPAVGVPGGAAERGRTSPPKELTPAKALLPLSRATLLDNRASLIVPAFKLLAFSWVSPLPAPLMDPADTLPLTLRLPNVPLPDRFRFPTCVLNPLATKPAVLIPMVDPEIVSGALTE